MGKLDDLYNFREKRFTAYNHSLRIYIHGVEVSQWLRGSLSITYNGRDSYNNASFEIVNPRRIFQITEENLCGPTGKCSDDPVMREGDHEYSESAKAKVFAMKQRLNGQAKNLFFDTLNSGIIVKGAALGTESLHSVQGANPFARNKFFPPKTYEEARYRLYVDDCIFNKNDYVRIFKKNPFQAYKDEWVEIFCGFIQDKPVTTNYITGESRINVSCSCIKQIMQKMRVNINVHLSDVDQGTQIIDQDFYNDFLNPSKLTHPFAQSNLENTIKTLILGSPNPARNPADMSAEEKKRKVGKFKLGNIVCYDPSNPGNILERWHLMTVFGVNKVPFPQGGNRDDLWLTGSEMHTIGKATRTGDDADAIVGGPSARYLHMLLPKSGTGPGSLIQYDLVQAGSSSDRREWSTRWEIIRDFASKLDFQVLTSPSGDILVEFPQYGFTPCAYLTNFNSGAKAGPDGTVGDSAKAAKKSKSSKLSGSSTGKGSKKAFQQCHVGRPDGSYENAIANLFLYRIHVKEETLNDEAEDFPTLLQVSGGFAFQGGAVPSAKQEVLNPRAILYSPVLVARYGAISESVDFPFAGQRKDEFGDDKAAFTKRLVKLGMIEFIRRMADASTWQGSLVYRPFQFPNRPVHLRRCHRMGLVSKVSYTYNVGKDVSMSMDCHMLMARRHDGSYRLMTGSVNTPIDYGAIWDSTDATTKDGGVVATTSDQAKKDGATAATESSNTTTPPPPVQGSNRDLGALMPEFRVLIDDLIKASEDAHPGNPLIVSPVANTVSRPFKAGGVSSHSLGLAVDLVPLKGIPGITGKIKTNEAARPFYQDINRAYQQKFNPHNDRNRMIEWGGQSRTYSEGALDNVHYQAPRAWMGSHATRGSASQAFAQDMREKNSGIKQAEVVERVWAALRANTPGLSKIAADNDLPRPTLDEEIIGEQEECSGGTKVKQADGTLRIVNPNCVIVPTQLKRQGNKIVSCIDDSSGDAAGTKDECDEASPQDQEKFKSYEKAKAVAAEDAANYKNASGAAGGAQAVSNSNDVASTPSVPCEGTSFLQQRGLKVS